MRLVIADDSEAMRRLLLGILRRQPFPIEVVGEAKNGEEAVRLYRECQPDLLFTDMIMPAMNGLEVLRSVRAEFPKARVILVTSISETATVLQCKEEGALGYVLKPFEADRIAKLLAHTYQELIAAVP